MKEIPRPKYLQSLISKKENGLVKIVTGIRRSGKSYLLDPIYKNYLLEQGVKKDHIIIFSTHILELAMDLCDEIVVLNDKMLTKVPKNAKKNEIIEMLKESKNVWDFSLI